MAKEAEFIAAGNDLMQQVTGNPLLEEKVQKIATAYHEVWDVLLAVIHEKPMLLPLRPLQRRVNLLR